MYLQDNYSKIGSHLKFVCVIYNFIGNVLIPEKNANQNNGQLNHVQPWPLYAESAELTLRSDRIFTKNVYRRVLTIGRAEFFAIYKHLPQTR